MSHFCSCQIKKKRHLRESFPLEDMKPAIGAALVHLEHPEMTAMTTARAMF